MVVAVIDSGVNKMDGMLQEQDIEDIYYEDQEFKTCYVGKLNPHGTEIIKVLLKEAPDIKILCGHFRRIIDVCFRRLSMH